MKKMILARRRLLMGGMVGLATAATGLLPARAADAQDSCDGFPRETFEDYIATFSANDTDSYGKYYTDDLLYERGDHVMHGPEEVLAFYREVHKHLTQKLKVVNYAATDTFIGAEVHSEFTVFKDFKHEQGGLDMKKGTHFIGHNFVHYGVRNGKICHIKSASFKRIA